MTGEVRIELDFPYRVRIHPRSRRTAGAHLSEGRSRLLYGTTTLRLRRVRESDFPVALRSWNHDCNRWETFHSDGTDIYTPLDVDLDEISPSLRFYTKTGGTGHWRVNSLFLGGRMDNRPHTAEAAFVRPSDGSMVEDGRADAVAAIEARAARLAVTEGGEIHERVGLPCLQVKAPGSAVPFSRVRLTRTPRVEMRIVAFEDLDRDAECAGSAVRDLLFLPEEVDAAMRRAGELGRRPLLRAPCSILSALPAPDLSAGAMAAWAASMRATLTRNGEGGDPIVVAPAWEGGARMRLPEVEGPIAAFRDRRRTGEGSAALLPAFLGLAAAFRTSVAAAAATRRPDVAALLEMHGRIAARAEERMVRAGRMNPADEAALAGIG